jgi:tetratricopeptide (TPR) repeat protein
MLIEDFILRQISLLAAFLAKVTGLSKAGQFQEARAMIDQAIEETLGLNANIVKQMDQAGLLNLLTTLNVPDSGKALVIANLFEAEGDVLALQGNKEESQECYQRALNLLLEITPQSPDDFEKEWALKIDGLESKLSDTEIDRKDQPVGC